MYPISFFKNKTDSLKIGLITKLVLYRKIKLIIKKEESNTYKKKLDRLQSEKRQFNIPKRRVIEISSIIFHPINYHQKKGMHYHLV